MAAVAERRRGLAESVLARWQPLALGLAALVILNVLAHVLVIRRTGAVSGDREVILRTARERLAGVRTEVDGLARTSSKLACTRSEIARVYDDLLSSKEERMTSIQREVRKLAVDRGLDPDRISYSPSEVKDTGLVRFTISFPLEGDYSTLEDFVNAVEDSENFLIIEQVSMVEADGRKLRLNVDLATYFQAPDAAAVARALARGGRS